MYGSPDFINSWSYLSSIGSTLTLFNFILFISKFILISPFISIFINPYFYYYFIISSYSLLSFIINNIFHLFNNFNRVYFIFSIPFYSLIYNLLILPDLYFHYLFNCNHKFLGLIYFILSSIFFITSFSFSFYFRSELFIFYFYNFSFTIHGLFMIFFIIMPGLYGGFGNYFIILYSGLSEIIFPRINNYSLFLLFSSFSIIFKCVILEYSLGIGWTFYPPLSILSTIIISLILESLLFSGLSSELSSFNYFSLLILHYILNLFSHSIIITAFILIFTLPILTALILLLFSDLYFDSIYFIIHGDPILFQHLFWYFGHPEVYILIIPAFGIISLIISVLSLKIIFGREVMILAIISISIFGSIVWGHHIYTISLEIENKIYYSNSSFIISLPTGTKIYNWISIYLGNYIYIIFLSLSFGIIFIIIFTFGGITGIILGNDILDLTLHDSYYILAHFHFILSLGAIISIISGLLFLKEFSYFRFYIFKINKVYFIFIFISINLIFSPLYFIGFNFIPRRIFEFPDFINSWSYLSSISRFNLYIDFYFHCP